MGLNHPDRGSCLDESCEYHGYCHDGCGEATWIAPYNDVKRGYVRGAPSIWKSGHRYGARHVFTPEQKARAIAGAHRADVPVERVEKLAFWLLERFGGIKPAAEFADLKWQTFYEIIMPKRRRRNIKPATALAITKAVLRARRADVALPPLPREVLNLRSDDQIPAAPVREALERYMTDEGISAQKMQDWYAERFAVERRTGHRHYTLVRRYERIPLTVADRWCALVGVPLDYVYAEEAS